jgi:UDP-N-acetylmuramoylalanine--D-glutamate ligase
MAGGKESGMAGVADARGATQAAPAQGEAGRPRLGSVLVLGCGGSGRSVARYCATEPAGRVDSVTVYAGLKAPAPEVVSELEGLGCAVVSGTEDVQGSYDLCVSSPGISVLKPFFKSAEAASAEVVSEPEFAWRESPGRWVAITGTNGKTTTTTLVRDLLCAGGMGAQEVGNIGVLATEQLRGRAEGSWFVAELSSFQLACCSRLHPRVGVLLNITPDHLEWHGTGEAYAAAKERLFANMGAGDLAVVGVGDEGSRAIAGRLEGRGLRVCRVSVEADPGTPEAAWVEAGSLHVRLSGATYDLPATEELPLKGSHNWQNMLAASACALELGVAEQDVAGCLRSFVPLEHRIEGCGEVAGVRYVDDSKATNVDAAEKALTAFPAGSMVLLLGGHDKGTDLSGLARQVAALCKAAVCYGEAGERFERALQDAGVASVSRVPHMADAFEAARAIAEPGEVVLLSPACSSFDEFPGFEARGDAFKALVAEAKAAEGRDGRR